MKILLYAGLSTFRLEKDHLVEYEGNFSLQRECCSAVVCLYLLESTEIMWF